MSKTKVTLNYAEEMLNKANKTYASGYPFSYFRACKKYKQMAKFNPEEFKKNTQAIINLANVYYKKKLYDEAFGLFEIAADKENPTAVRKLANCYMFGRGTEMNYSKAFKLYQKAVDCGDELSEVYLATCYDYGKGTEQNYQLAFEYYSKAAQNGYIWAKRRLGDYYFEGICVETDYQKAVEHYKICANADDSESMEKLLTCYSEGKGVEKSKLKTVWYFLCSCTQADIPIYKKVQ